MATTKATTKKKTATKRTTAKSSSARKKSSTRKTSASGTKKKTSTKKTSKANASAKKTATKRTPGILDHAASILTSSKEPMSCKDIVEQAISKHGWKTSGKTPNATLYAAIIREISKKGKNARFTKVDRGRFASNGKGA